MTILRLKFFIFQPDFLIALQRERKKILLLSFSFSYSSSIYYLFQKRERNVNKKVKHLLTPPLKQQ